MKKFLFLLCLTPLTGLTQEFKCTSPVNPKKAVVFINLNGSFLEVEAAEKAACARGETFVHIPPMTQEMKVFATVYMEKELKEDSYVKECRSGARDPARCDPLSKELQESWSKLNDANKKISSVDQVMVQKELKTLAEKNISTTSVILSGHDGGGAVSGELGRINKGEFMQAYDEAYRNKPQLKNELQSALLWGCYTSTPTEVMQWKARYPQMKIIAGFAGSGPSHLRDAGHRLLNDILVKEKSILETSTMDAAQIAIQGLDGAGETFIGMYAQCGDKKDQYYATNEHMDPKFERFEDKIECVNQKKAIEILRIEHGQYFYGNFPLPADTSSGPLRDIYTSTRALAHCIDQDSFQNADKTGLLLFYKGVRNNFSQTFEEEIKNAKEDCANAEDIISKNVQDFSNPTNTKKEILESCEVLKEYLTISDTPPSRKTITELVNDLHGIGFLDKSLDPNNTFKLRDLMPHMMKMKELMERYLYGLDTECMDFDLWHDYKPGVIAKPKC